MPRSVCRAPSAPRPNGPSLTGPTARSARSSVENQTAASPSPCRASALGQRPSVAGSSRAMHGPSAVRRRGTARRSAPLGARERAEIRQTRGDLRRPLEVHRGPSDRDSRGPVRRRPPAAVRSAAGAREVAHVTRRAGGPGPASPTISKPARSGTAGSRPRCRRRPRDRSIAAGGDRVGCRGQRDQLPEAAAPARARRPDRGEVARAIERRPPGHRRGLAVDPDQVVRERRVRRAMRRSRLSTPVARSSSTSKASHEDRDDRGDRRPARPSARGPTGARG